MKTAAAVLQEYAVKLGRTPEYECVAQTGPQHQSTFEYRCTLCDETAKATARSKKDAKQEAANALLIQLSKAGHVIPPPWGLGIGTAGGKVIGAMGMNLGTGPVGVGVSQTSPVGAIDPHSYVALLKEYCEEYKLTAPEYTLIGDTGPPHLRSFTFRVSVDAHWREATALNKKTARQMAAEAIYKYLRGCLRSTQDFVEVDALTRSIDKKMGRFKEERKEIPYRPPLNQRISEYHNGLVFQFDESKRAGAMDALRTTAEAGQPPEVQLECAASQLGLELEWDELPTESGQPLVTVELPTTSPSLVYIGRDRNDAAACMVDYLLMCLPNPKRSLVSINVNEPKNTES